jgi:hypothetical protein
MTWRPSLGERRPQLHRSESLKTQNLNTRNLFIFPYRVAVSMSTTSCNLQNLDKIPTLNNDLFHEIRIEKSDYLPGHH